MKKLSKILFVLGAVGLTSSANANVWDDTTFPPTPNYTGIGGLTGDWANNDRTRINDVYINIRKWMDNAIYMDDVLYTNIVNLQNDFNTKVQNKLDDMEEKAASGIATSNALTGLDSHLDNGKSFGFGVGTGYHNSQGGVFRTTTNSALNFGAAVATGGGVSAKAGWNMQF